MENYRENLFLQAKVLKTTHLQLLEETRKSQGQFYLSKGSLSLRTQNKNNSHKELFLLKNQYLFMGKKINEKSDWKVYRFKRDSKKDHFLNTLFSKKDLKKAFRLKSTKLSKKGFTFHLDSLDKSFKNIEIRTKEIKNKQKTWVISHVSWKDSLDNKTTLVFEDLKILKTPLKDSLFSLPKGSVVNSL